MKRVGHAVGDLFVGLLGCALCVVLVGVLALGAKHLPHVLWGLSTALVFAIAGVILYVTIRDS